MSRTESLFNLLHLWIVVSERDISAVNLVVGLFQFVCSMNWLTTSLLVGSG